MMKVKHYFSMINFKKELKCLGSNCRCILYIYFRLKLKEWISAMTDRVKLFYRRFHLEKTLISFGPQNVGQNESGYGSSTEVSPMRSRVPTHYLKSETVNSHEYGECRSAKKRLKSDDQGTEYEDENKKKFCDNWFNIKINLKYCIRSGVYTCQTNGRESILTMIKNKLAELKILKSTKHMLFGVNLASDGYVVNLGLPTGVLKTDQEYQCIFKTKLGYEIDSLVRELDVFDFRESWDIKYFYVKFPKHRAGQPNVSKMAKIVDSLQVPFLREESYFQALVRDKRFGLKDKSQNLIIRSCHFQNDKGECVSLSDKASPQICFVFHHSKADAIADEVLPLRRPLHVPATVSSSPKHTGTLTLPVSSIKQEQEESLSKDLPQLSSAELPINESSNSTPKKRWSKEDKLRWIEEKFHLDFQTKKTAKAENKRQKAIADFCCSNFALGFNHHILVEDMKDLVNDASRCVGAVIAVKVKTKGDPIEKDSAGTCFRIGKHYIITNAHVLDKIEKHGYKPFHIDFNYKSNETITCNIDAAFAVLKVKELDYCILKLEGDEAELPPNITSLNYPIGLPDFNIDEPISLIGHPGGYAKSIDTSCPIKPPSQDQSSQLYIRQQENSTIQYDVTSFFEGSSGSPGFCLRSRKAVVVHSRGLHQQEPFRFEEGILLSAIVLDVKSRIENGSVSGVTLGDIFGDRTAENFENATPMDTNN